MAAEALGSSVDWPALSYSIADLLCRVEQDSSFSFEKFDGEFDEFDLHVTSRYVQFCAHGPGWLRCEVVSNRFLPQSEQHSAAQERELDEMGWNAPDDDDGSGSPNWWIDVELVWVDFAADMVVQVFRDVWGVERLEQLVCDKDRLRHFRWLELPEALR